MNEVLLELQSVDTLIDQLRHRLGVLPELAAAQGHREQLLAWEAQRAEMQSRTAELESLVESAEQQAAELDMHKLRLSGQLKTVIAPREAEALQSEMRTLSDRRDALDDQELEAMEEMSEIEIRLGAHLAQEPALREALTDSDAALAAAQGQITAEVQALEERRSGLREQISADLLARYDHLRTNLGVAVARLVGRRCEGCHMDLSPVEVDLLKAIPEGQLAECPQCTRILVR